ncbi:DUF6343 family protein [Streptomyces sp. NPDC008313]|uniref:DUF6343 family protein n=1 Tax=Streptomyces sp. NPDC008313 TaxID=3364826 RepID=UPI0036E7C064
MQENRSARARRPVEPAARPRSRTTGPPVPGSPGTGRRAGTEPRDARSPLRLRMLLSGTFLPLFAAAAVVLAVWAARSGPGDTPGSGPLTVLAAVCAVLALVAAVDPMVVSRRVRHERTRHGRGDTR